VKRRDVNATVGIENIAGGCHSKLWLRYWYKTIGKGGGELHELHKRLERRIVEKTKICQKSENILLKLEHWFWTGKGSTGPQWEAVVKRWGCEGGVKKNWDIKTGGRKELGLEGYDEGGSRVCCNRKSLFSTGD